MRSVRSVITLRTVRCKLMTPPTRSSSSSGATPLRARSPPELGDQTLRTHPRQGENAGKHPGPGAEDRPAVLGDLGRAPVGEQAGRKDISAQQHRGNREEHQQQEQTGKRRPAKMPGKTAPSIAMPSVVVIDAAARSRSSGASHAGSPCRRGAGGPPPRRAGSARRDEGGGGGAEHRRQQAEQHDSPDHGLGSGPAGIIATGTSGVTVTADPPANHLVDGQAVHRGGKTRLRAEPVPGPPAPVHPRCCCPSRAKLRPHLALQIGERHSSCTAQPPRGRCAAPPRRSYSSRISPTICSSTSSSVTMPEVPPNSSTTTARWLALRWKSRSCRSSDLASGTHSTGRMSRCQSSGPVVGTESGQVLGVHHAGHRVGIAVHHQQAGSAPTGEECRSPGPGLRKNPPR